MQFSFLYIRLVFLGLMLTASFCAQAQKPAPAPKKPTAQKDKAKPADTLLRVDPATGIEYYKGQIVYSANNMPPDRPGLRPNTPPAPDEQGLMKYLLDNLSEEFKQLPDEDYYLDIRHIVIDELGRVVHADNKGILSVAPLSDGSHIPAGADAVMRKIALILNAASCKPACINSVFVPYMLQDLTAKQKFTIKDDKAITN